MVSPAAASEQQNATRAPISSGWTSRSCGLLFAISRMISSSVLPDDCAMVRALCRSISVSAQVGLTATQVTPWGPPSMATAPGQAHEPRLGGAVGGMGGLGVARRRGGDIDNPSPAALLHGGNAGPYHAKRPAQVGIDHLFPVGIGMTLHDMMGGYAGTVHQDVRFAEGFANPYQETLDGLNGRDIQRCDESMVAERESGVPVSLEIPCLAGSHGNPCAGFRQGLGDGEADAPKTARDDGDA